ncbi:glycosyltransferase family 2 protein [Lacinutrix chionoecetis]
MAHSLISIIIPVFNRETIIKSTLDSILKQTHSNWECLIIDDGSTDNTKNTIKEYSNKNKNFQCIKRPNHLVKGANSCRNYGFTIAKGEYINWFDSDDIMKPTFLEEKLKAFEKNTDAVIHRNNYANYALTNFRDSKFEYNNGKNLFYNYAMENIEIQTCGFMWRKRFLEGKKLFDEHIMRYQDNEFHIRMLAIKTLNVKIIDKVLATIRSGDEHESQISSKTKLTKQKLYDVFYYRYQCLKLAKEGTIAVDAVFNKTIAKKTLWAFYAGLRFEKSFFKRFKDVLKHNNKLHYVYASPQITITDGLKSQFYILKTIVFR